MTLDELQKQAEKDLKIDDVELGDESLKTANLHQKYLNIYNNFRQLQLMSDAQYRILYRKKWEYYGGKADAKIYVTKPFDLKVLKTDLNIYIESDEEIIKLEHKIAYLETTIKYIDGVLRSIQSRGWDIKNAISWKQFEAGMI